MERQASCWPSTGDMQDLVSLFEQRGVLLNLFEACAAGRRGRVAELLDRAPSLIWGFSEDGHTALGLAVFFGHDEIAALLIENGADVNAASKNSQHVTALHAAVARRNARLVSGSADAGSGARCGAGGGLHRAPQRRLPRRQRNHRAPARLRRGPEEKDRRRQDPGRPGPRKGNTDLLPLLG